ncbi:Rieske (2Fe-2S) protein [Mucilaginibacter lappiensis]|jgi:nitrite reductase/ring-hydroxylating ferredoxin subunit|uniref:Rieske (2Fe-2S) protein n=1 Tax=Mucilaginibacter lappiensis TaxID=354630 RepID=UPI003D212115
MRKLILVILISICYFSCGKGDPVPSLPVNFEASKTDPRLSALNSQGGAVLINGYGVAGLIIYRRGDGVYVAYDRCSSYQPEKKCAVTLDDTGFTVTDPCSGSKFSLNDGTPVKAPATRALRSYQVVTTQFTIQVIN